MTIHSMLLLTQINSTGMPSGTFLMGATAQENAERHKLPQHVVRYPYCLKNTEPHPVDQKLPNHWGLYDILGNVWEWVQLRLLYGKPPPVPGHWSCRSATRTYILPANIGFRLIWQP